MDSQKAPEMSCPHQAIMVGIYLIGARTVRGPGRDHYHGEPSCLGHAKLAFSSSYYYTTVDDENPDSETSDSDSDSD